MNSREAQQQIVDAYYLAYLGRAAEPAGEAAWVNMLQSNTLTLNALAAFFLASPEYASDVASGELDRHCLERIARFKRPKQYHFIDALPKNSYGKVLKRELKDRLASGRDSTEKHT